MSSTSIYQSTKVSPYVYWLTHKTSGQFYIGYREANIIPSDQDLPIYKSSSDKIDELGFENFEWKIIAEFFDGDSAWYQEQRIIEANIKNPLCINGHFVKEDRLQFRKAGIPLSEEHKAKISASRKGVPNSPEARKKIGDKSRGRKCSIATRQQISKIITNITSRNWRISFQDGKMENVFNLKAWCKENDINVSSLTNTMRYDTYYKGMKVSRV